MAIPSKVKLTPTAAVTVAAGASTDASSEFWQRVSGNVHIVYENVPFWLMQEILQNDDGRLDTHISTRLAAYPKRVSS